MQQEVFLVLDVPQRKVLPAAYTHTVDYISNMQWFARRTYFWCIVVGGVVDACMGYSKVSAIFKVPHVKLEVQLVLRLHFERRAKARYDGVI